jgi:hypothetical protein
MTPPRAANWGDEEEALDGSSSYASFAFASAR